MVNMMILSCFLGMSFTTGGLWLSYTFDMTSGAAIIFLAGIVFFLSMGADHLLLLGKSTQSE
jgi:zinc transport system permease protein